jgi:hypothetical protein
MIRSFFLKKLRFLFAWITSTVGAGTGSVGTVLTPFEVSKKKTVTYRTILLFDRLTECDRESASNTAVAGYSLTGSVASSYLGQHRYSQFHICSCSHCLWSKNVYSDPLFAECWIRIRFLVLTPESDPDPIRSLPLLNCRFVKKSNICSLVDVKLPFQFQLIFGALCGFWWWILCRECLAVIGHHGWLKILALERVAESTVLKI